MNWGTGDANTEYKEMAPARGRIPGIEQGLEAKGTVLGGRLPRTHQITACRCLSALLHAGQASVNRNCLRSKKQHSVLTMCEVSDKTQPDPDKT